LKTGSVRNRVKVFEPWLDDGRGPLLSVPKTTRRALANGLKISRATICGVPCTDGGDEPALFKDIADHYSAGTWDPATVKVNA
jgi:hypothetical protein